MTLCRACGIPEYIILPFLRHIHSIETGSKGVSSNGLHDEIQSKMVFLRRLAVLVSGMATAKYEVKQKYLKILLLRPDIYRQVMDIRECPINN